MAEEKAGLESSQEASGGGVDPIAAAIALGGASREEADAFLRNQNTLVDLQKHHLRAQLLPALSEKWLGVVLRVATACVGIAVAGALSFMVWVAAHSSGLIVEPFSVPPDLAEKGMTGEVVAARVLDRLTLLQSRTNTARPARSYTNAWSEHDIKLEIPETGVSLSELDRWLREKLGHDTRVSGEIVHVADGITITGRAGTDGAATVSGADADVDALVGKLAESLYRITQPYRYAMYLRLSANRTAEAVPIFKDLALNGSPEDRLWSYNMWAQAAGNVAGDTGLLLKMYQQALAADPEAMGVYTNLAPTLAGFGRYEEALQVYRDSFIRLHDGKQTYTPADLIPAVERREQAALNRLVGAYHDAALVQADNVRTGIRGFNQPALLSRLIASQLGEHDLAATRVSLADVPPGAYASRTNLQIALAAGDWRQALGLGTAMADYLKANPHDRHWAIVTYAPPLALAQAQLGDFTAAERSIAPTPADCYPCLIARAQIAELRGQQGRADFWFAHADQAGPSLPFAFEAEGRALLGRGKPDDAIARFTIANQKGPHFADPLEGWGEALMAKNQSHLAPAKFAEAEKYAPNWGRLQLKWGEALMYAGKATEAKAHFARAAALDLTPSEKSELARHP